MAEKPTLKDVLNYSPDEYLTKGDIDWIKRTFSTPDGIRILRKVFIPTLSDPSLPIEDFAKEPYMIDTDWRQIPDHEVKNLVVGRQDAIKYIFGGLIKLKVLASQKALSEEEEIALRRANSTK